MVESPMKRQMFGISMMKCWFVIRSMKQTNLFQNESGIALHHNCLKCLLVLIPNNLAVTFPSIAAGIFYQKMMKSLSLNSTSFTGGPVFFVFFFVLFFFFERQLKKVVLDSNT